MIDDELHKNTQYRIPFLVEQIKKEKDRVGSFVMDCNEPNWDSYNAFPISVETIKFTGKVLDEIEVWFKKNIGFLNNKSIEFDSYPTSDGRIDIIINYDESFECTLWIEAKELIDCLFWPKHKYMLDGTKTIADRDFEMIFPKDMIRVKCKLSDISYFLDEAFYNHKWRF